jgi:F-type H+-transporting ATPase subunit b
LFIGQLRQLEGEKKASFAQALRGSAEPILVRSAFELTGEQQAAIRQILSEDFAAQVAVRFDDAPDLIAGIELTAGGRRVGWSIEDYLKGLKDGIGGLVGEQESSQGTPAAESESIA